MLRSLRNGPWLHEVARRGKAGGVLGTAEAAWVAGPTSPIGSVPGAHGTWGGVGAMMSYFLKSEGKK